MLMLPGNRKKKNQSNNHDTFATLRRINALESFSNKFSKHPLRVVKKHPLRPYK